MEGEMARAAANAQPRVTVSALRVETACLKTAPCAPGSKTTRWSPRTRATVTKATLNISEITDQLATGSGGAGAAFAAGVGAPTVGAWQS
eukprot:2071121-Pleurochrysis_carterae.AAC.1